MKRFYKSAAAHIGQDGFEVRLDGRPVRTPGRNLLTLPTAALAEASADEWNAQDETLDMGRMPMTALAYAATDRIAADPGQFVALTAKYAETDLLCYRAPNPESLRDRQAAAWDPLLAWFGERHGATFRLADGVMPIEQPAEALAAAKFALEALDPFQLTAAHTATGIAGSVVIGLALTEGRIDAATAAETAALDDLYQLEEWGEDADARALINRRRAALEDVGAFLSLLR